MSVRPVVSDRTETQVAIIGSGPAGLLGHLLRAAGIDCVTIDRRSGNHRQAGFGGNVSV